MVNLIDPASLLAHAFQSADLPLPGKQTGKVRDWYPISAGKRLFIYRPPVCL
jgi:hypothetical protein